MSVCKTLSFKKRPGCSMKQLQEVDTPETLRLWHKKFSSLLIFSWFPLNCLIQKIIKITRPKEKKKMKKLSLTVCSMIFMQNQK